MKSKKILSFICMTAVIVSFASCSSKSKTDDTQISAYESDYESSEQKTTVPETKPVISSDDSFSDIVEKDIEDTVSSLEAEYEQLKSDIDTYEKYSENIDKIESFYKHIYEIHKNLCIKMYDYSLEYAEQIVFSDKSNSDKYDDLQDLYDIIYDDAGDDIYDGFYDGILDDMYDDFYDGILKKARKNENYSEWSEISSNEYELWSDTHSDVYNDWSDFRSDVYNLWSDVRSELWKDDIDRAKKKIDDFRKDIDKIKGKSDTDKDKTAEKNESSESAKNNDNSSDNDIRPEFKEAMDSYESFFDEYIEFMNKYKNADTNEVLGMLSDYNDYFTKYSETMEKMNDIDEEELSEKEIEYYIEVTARINKKLTEVY